MTATGNLLLDNLGSLQIQQDILQQAQEITIPRLNAIVEQGERPRHLVFLTSGLSSAVVRLEDGQAPEVEVIGPEGLVGFRTLLDQHTFGAAYIAQTPAFGLRVPYALLRTLFHNSPDFQESVLEFDVGQANVAAQLSACNIGHNAKQRVVRWLLMAADRLRSDVIPVTQEQIAEKLDLRRTTVNLTLIGLEKSLVIGLSRHRVTISDRQALEALSCECYRVCHKIFHKMYLKG